MYNKTVLSIYLTIFVNSFLSADLVAQTPTQGNTTRNVIIDLSSTLISAPDPSSQENSIETDIGLAQENYSNPEENSSPETKPEPVKNHSGWTCKGWVKQVLALKIHPAPGVIPLALTNSYTSNVILISKIPEIEAALVAAKEQRENDLPRECQNWIRQGLFNPTVKNNYYVDGAVIEVAEQMTKKINSQMEKENRKVYKALRKARRVQAVITDNIQNDQTTLSNASDSSDIYSASTGSYEGKNTFLTQ